MAASEFEVVVRVVGGRAVLEPRGDIDAYSGPNLSEHLTTAVADHTGDVTLDLSNVTFVDSSGIAVFVAAAKQLRERGNELIVASPPRMVTKLLEMTGVTKLVKLAGSGR